MTAPRSLALILPLCFSACLTHAHDGRAEARSTTRGVTHMSAHVQGPRPAAVLRVEGLEDRQHVSGTIAVTARASSVEAPVRELVILVDGFEVARGEGGRLDWSWETRGLEAGAHTVEAVALRHGAGRLSRQMQVFAGPAYLHHLRAHEDGAAVRVAAENVAPAGVVGTVELQVLPAGREGAFPVYVASVTATPGEVALIWDRRAPEGRAAAGRYLARFAFVDSEGITLHVAEAPFELPPLARVGGPKRATAG
jgi:hypothetical protein